MVASFTPRAPDWLDHPAVIAWMVASENQSAVTSVETLKRTKASSVFRLRQDIGTSTIAKLASAAITRQERLVYEHVLPGLPLSSLACFGSLAAGDGMAWLFLEDAGPVFPASPARVGAWLGTLHASAAQMQEPHLPRRDSRWYAEQLAGCQKAVTTAAGTTTTEAEALRRASVALARLTARWPEIASAIDAMPQTLVHCDLQHKNLTLQHGDYGSRLLVFDWEMSGWGCPAVDIYRGSSFGERDSFLAAYIASQASSGTATHIQDLQVVLGLGKVLWKILCLVWSSAGLPYKNSYAASLEEIESHCLGLDEALESYA